LREANYAFGASNPERRITIRPTDLLTMTDSDGVPLRNANTGDRNTARLLAGEDARRVASRLTLAHWRQQRGVPGFDRPIRYSERGWS
jgi:hypothetical protein